jgi:hypothetical protein
MKRSIVCALLIVLLVIGTSFGATLQEYTDKLTERYTETLKSPAGLKGWENGVRKDYGVTFDHLTISFIAQDQKPSETEGNTLVAGTMRITVFGFKSNAKVHCLFERLLIIEVSPDNTTVQYLLLKETTSGVVPGWTGIDT